MQNEIKLSEFKEVIEYLIDNNRKLQDEGLSPISVCLEGDPGIGKSTSLRELAQEKGLTYVSLVLSQLEEVGDLCGLPIKEIWCTTKDKEGNIVGKWFPESMLSSLPIHISKTNKIRMSYAPPAWLPTEENPKGTLVVLDDFSRANSLFQNAIMEIINEQKYVSWSLPKYTTVCLTSNIDDGSMNISSLDDAQKTRFVNFQIKLDATNWAEWAEAHNIDGRAINFSLLYQDEIYKKVNNTRIVNPRSYTTFCKAISGIKNWSDPDSLALILQISKGCFLNDRDNIIGNLFTTFIANKLDKLIQPTDMLELKWDTLKPKMLDCVYDTSEGRSVYRPEIASVLTIRFVNHVLNLFSQKGGVKEAVVNDRILDFVNSEETIISEDLFFHMIKTLITKYPGRTGKLLLNTKIRNKVIL